MVALGAPGPVHHVAYGIAVAVNAGCPTFGAPGVLVLVTGDIAGIDIAQPGLVSDLGSTMQCGYGRFQRIEELVAGHEPGDMPGHVTVYGGQETGDGAQSLVVIVVTGDDERGHLYPNAHLAHLGDGIHDRLHARTAQLSIERIGALEVDVGGVQIGANGVQRFSGHVAVGHKDVLQAGRGSQPGTVVGILKEHGRLGVGVGDGPASFPLSQLDNLLRWQVSGPAFPARLFVGCLRDVGILAKCTPEIAAHGGDGKRSSAGVKVVEWFLLNWIHRSRDRPAVD